jgi:ERCC4-type nuclease
MVNIFVDHREDKNLIKELYKLDLFFEQKQLKVGDFIINTFIKGKEEVVAIERKTQIDFLTSIIDKRLLLQLDALRTNYKVPLLIIEGEENMYQLREFHPNAVRGMLVTISIDFQIPIVYTRNIKDTARFIQNIAARMGRVKRPISLIDRKKPVSLDEQKQFVLESLPGVGPTLASNLLKRFGSISSIVNATDKDLKEIDKMGPKKISKIREVLDN